MKFKFFLYSLLFVLMLLTPLRAMCADGPPQPQDAPEQKEKMPDLRLDTGTFKLKEEKPAPIIEKVAPPHYIYVDGVLTKTTVPSDSINEDKDSAAIEKEKAKQKKLKDYEHMGKIKGTDLNNLFEK